MLSSLGLVGGVYASLSVVPRSAIINNFTLSHIFQALPLLSTSHIATIKITHRHSPQLGPLKSKLFYHFFLHQLRLIKLLPFQLLNPFLLRLPLRPLHSLFFLLPPLLFL